MALILGHSTSRFFWRSVYPSDRAPAPAVGLMRGGSFLCNRRAVLAAVPNWALAGEKVFAYVFDRRLWRSGARVETRVFERSLPDRSFHAFGNGLYVTSPQCEFLNMATVLDIRQLVAFGDELCGCYSFDRSSKRGFRSREVPLTTKGELELYLSQAEGCRGYRCAMRALRHVVEGSASPMESSVEMLNSLPVMLGGYALPVPRMNYRVPLNESSSMLAERAYCVADMCYPEKKLDIEYHGRLDHDSADGFVSDRARVNALIKEGYEVLELTYDQVGSLLRYEEIVKHIAKCTGKRLRPAALGATPARIDLRRVLKEWNRSYGEPCA